jgi:hypothetical protein
MAGGMAPRLVSPGVGEPYDARYGDLVVRVVGCQHLLEEANGA